MTEFDASRTDVITKHLESSERTFDAYAILDWYDGIIKAIALKDNFQLALLLTARFSHKSNYLYTVTELPYAQCRKWLQTTSQLHEIPSGDRNYIVWSSDHEVNTLIEKAVPLEMILEMGEIGGKYGSRWAVRRVWSNRVPWY